MPGQFWEGKYVSKSLHMRVPAHGSLSDGTNSARLKKPVRKVQQRVSIDLEQSKYVSCTYNKVKKHSVIVC